jgi:hypothetical protein
MGHRLGGPGKGKTNNPNGRPKGTPNRTTKEAREFLDCMMFGQLDNMNDALNSLYEKDQRSYLDACSKLFTYVLPKKTDITSGDEKLLAQLPIIQIRTKNGSD